MKLKIDQSDIKNFFANHVEKLIMVVAAVLLGYFLWNGFSAKPSTTISPVELKTIASSTKDYLAQDTWPKMAEYRKPDVTAPDRIRATADAVANVAGYGSGNLAPMVKDAGLRRDPELLVAQDLIARPLAMQIFVAPESTGDTRLVSGMDFLKDEMRELKEKEEAEKSKREKDKDKDKDKDKEKKANAPPKNSGDKFDALHRIEYWGTRPEKVSRMIPVVSSVIEVVGLVPFEAQWGKYNEVFRGSRGYFPDRDRPTYTYMQIARQVEGEEWNENYQDIIDVYEDSHLLDVRSPEAIDPYYYDPVLTRRFPAVAFLDHREISTHPKVPLRKVAPSFLWVKEETDKRQKLTEEDLRRMAEEKSKQDAKDKDKEPQTDEKKDKDPKRDEIERLKGSNMLAYEEAVASKVPQAPFKLIRFIDYNPPANKKVRYRVKLWLLDANDPPETVEIGKKSNKNKAAVGMGAEGGDSDKSGGKAKAEYVKVPVTTDMLHPEVAKRIRAKLDLNFPEEKQVLFNSVATEWSKETDFIDPKAPPPAEVYASTIVEPASIAIGDVRLPRGEPKANLVASFASRDLGTNVPAPKLAARAEWLNFTMDRINLLHPTTFEVVTMRNGKVQANLMVVDMLGGEEVRLSEVRDARILTENPNAPDGFDQLFSKYTEPSEVLVMDAQGKFRIKNSVDDYKKYRAALFMPDETNEFGKKPADKEKKEGNRKGPPGGGGPGDGGPGGGDGGGGGGAG